jgi:moxR-like ATPase
MLFNEMLVTTTIKLLDANRVPALIGEPGIGKSSFVEDVARRTNTRCFTLPCNMLADKADLTGARLVLDEKTGVWSQKFFPHSTISKAIRYAEANPNEQPILFLDEINRTTSDVTSGTLTLVTLRCIGDEDLPKNLRIIVAGNDKGNVTALDDASVSRFAIINVAPDASTLIEVLGQNLHPCVKTVLEKHPETIFVKNTNEQVVADGQDDDDDDNATVSVFDLFDGTEEIRPFATPRTIDGVSQYLNVLSFEEIASLMATPSTTRDGRHVSYLQEVIEGMTGNTSFTTLLMGVISDELSKGSTGNNNAQRVVKPRIYSELKEAAKTSVDAVNQVVATMTDNDASGCFVFAMYEREDNAVIIQALNERLTNLAQNHIDDFILLLSSGALYAKNCETVNRLDHGLAKQLNMFIEAMNLD